MVAVLLPARYKVTATVDAERLGIDLAEELLAQGAGEILQALADE